MRVIAIDGPAASGKSSTGARVAERLRRESQALAARDDADRGRTVAPLKPAPDAVLLDTTHVSLDEQVARVVALARERLPG